MVKCQDQLQVFLQMMSAKYVLTFARKLPNLVPQNFAPREYMFIFLFLGQGQIAGHLFNILRHNPLK